MLDRLNHLLQLFLLLFHSYALISKLRFVALTFLPKAKLFPGKKAKITLKTRNTLHVWLSLILPANTDSLGV
jgi:hypothetical protein